MDWHSLLDTSSSLQTALAKQELPAFVEVAQEAVRAANQTLPGVKDGPPSLDSPLFDGLLEAALSRINASRHAVVDHKLADGLPHTDAQERRAPWFGSSGGAAEAKLRDAEITPAAESFLERMSSALQQHDEQPCNGWLLDEQVFVEDGWVMAEGLDELYTRGSTLDDVIACFIDQPATLGDPSDTVLPRELRELRFEAAENVRALLEGQMTMPAAYTTGKRPWFEVGRTSLASAGDIWRYCVAMFHLSPSVGAAWSCVMDAMDFRLLSDKVSIATFLKWQEPHINHFNVIVKEYIAEQSKILERGRPVRQELVKGIFASEIGSESSFLMKVKSRLSGSSKSLQVEPSRQSKSFQKRSLKWEKRGAMGLKPNVTHKFVVNTYLQMVGRELIYRSTLLLPVLVQMPSTLPPIVIYRIIVAPFLKAMRLAVESLMDEPGEHISSFLSEQTPADEAKLYQRVYVIDGQAPRANPHFIVAKRSPMSILTSIYDDGYNFIRGLSSILKSLDLPLGLWHSNILKRLVDSIFVEQSTDIMRIVDVYITAMVKELEVSGEEADTEGMDVEMDLWPMVEGESFDENETVRPRNKPRRIHKQHQKSIAIIAQHLWRITRMPSVLHASMAMSCLHAMQTLMNVLVRVFQDASNATSQEGSPLAPYYALTGALCVKRRLRNMGSALDLPLADLNYQKFATQFAHVLNQADYVVKRVKKQLVQAHIQLFSETICADIEGTPWTSHRKPQGTWVQSASPAVRHWRFALLTMLHRLVSITSLEVTENVFGTVMMQSATDLGMRFGRHHPSWQWRTRYRSDVLHVVLTIIALSGVIEIQDEQQLPSGELRLVKSDVQPAKGHLEVLDTVAYALIMRAVLLACDASDLVQRVAGANFLSVDANQAVRDSAAAQRGTKKATAWNWVPSHVLHQWQCKFSHIDLTKVFNPTELFDLTDINASRTWSDMVSSMLPLATAADIIQVLHERPELQRPVAGMPPDNSREAGRSKIVKLARSWPLLQGSVFAGLIDSDGYATAVPNRGFDSSSIGTSGSCLLYGATAGCNAMPARTDHPAPRAAESAAGLESVSSALPVDVQRSSKTGVSQPDSLDHAGSVVRLKSCETEAAATDPFDLAHTAEARESGGNTMAGNGDDAALRRSEHSANGSPERLPSRAPHARAIAPLPQTNAFAALRDPFAASSATRT